MQDLIDLRNQLDTPEFQALPVWERRRVVGEAFDKFQNRVPQDLLNQETLTALDDLKTTALDKAGPINTGTLGLEAYKSAKVAADSAVHSIPRMVETVGGVVTGNPNFKLLPKKVLPEIATEAEIAARPIEDIGGSIVGAAPLSALSAPAAALGKTGKIGKALEIGAKTIAPLIPAEKAAGNIAQAGVFGIESAVNRARAQGEDATPEQIADAAVKGAAFGAATLGGAKVLGAGIKSLIKPKGTVKGEVKTSSLADEARKIVEAKKETPESIIKTTTQTIDEAKQTAKPVDKDIKVVNQNAVDVLAQKLTKKQGEADLPGGPILSISANPIKKAAEYVTNKAQIVGSKTTLQPLRILKKELPEIDTLARESNARATLHDAIEKKYLRGLAELDVDPKEIPQIADVVDNIKVKDIISGKAGSPDLSPADKFNPQEAQRAAYTWNNLSDNAKARTILYARGLREAAINSGMKEEEMLPAYLPHRNNIRQWLEQNHPNYRSTDKPSFRYFRADDSTPGSVNMDELLLRYFAETRREILRNTVEAPIYKAAKEAAVKANRKEIVNALNEVERQLTILHNPEYLDNIVGKGIKTWVEQSVKGNISSGLANVTQGPQFLPSILGHKTTTEAASLIGDPKIKWLIDKLDLRKTGGAKFELQKNIMQEPGSESLLHQMADSPELNPQEALKKFAKDTDEKLLIDAFQSGEVYLNQPWAIIGGMLRKTGSKETLLETLDQLQKSEAQKGYLSAEESSALSQLVAEGQAVNEQANFVPIAGNRSPYENAQLARMVLPLIRFPVKEAGFVADMLWDSATLPTAQERMAAFGGLANYLGVKSLITGGKGVATLFVPAAFAAFFQGQYPEAYKHWEDSLQWLDEHTNIPKMTTGVDLSQQHGLLDPTVPLAQGNPAGVLDIANTPVGRQVKSLGSVPSQLADPDIRKKAKGAATLLKLAPIPNINVGGASVGIGGGQIGELIQAGANLATGSRRVGSHEFKTTPLKEAKRIVAPLAEDAAVYDEPLNKKTAMRYLEKGVEPSKAVIKELTTAATGGEKGIKARLAEEKVWDDLGSAVKKEYKTKYYEAFKGRDMKEMVKTYGKLLKFGLTPNEVDKFLTDKLEDEAGIISDKSQRNRTRRVQALRSGLKR